MKKRRHPVRLVRHFSIESMVLRRLSEKMRILAAILTTCAGESCFVTARGAEVAVVADEQRTKEQTVDAGVGDVIAISAPARPGTGYVWSAISIPEFLQAEPQPGSTGEPAVPGGVRHQVLRFKVAGHGDGRLVLAHRRPWEKTAKGGREMTFFIRAK